ncbi:hypothetical protein CDD82_4390 [Ophiocordyceps australis]|uniref:Uncharacterized protein n=1 Tax=Ophiocordyceps australis TaxID=1399860 RepID=A0A2C5Z6Y3_9HYPO|nr:hypothetical protein CDD82_4390 [Ophiocordyceps australis]
MLWPRTIGGIRAFTKSRGCCGLKHGESVDATMPSSRRDWRENLHSDSQPRRSLLPHFMPQPPNKTTPHNRMSNPLPGVRTKDEQLHRPKPLAANSSLIARIITAATKRYRAAVMSQFLKTKAHDGAADDLGPSSMDGEVAPSMLDKALRVRRDEALSQRLAWRSRSPRPVVRRDWTRPAEPLPRSTAAPPRSFQPQSRHDDGSRSNPVIAHHHNADADAMSSQAFYATNINARYKMLTYRHPSLHAAELYAAYGSRLPGRAGSISSLLASLSHPTPFVDPLHRLGLQGYKVVSGSRDMLVLRKLEKLSWFASISSRLAKGKASSPRHRRLGRLASKLLVGILALTGLAYATSIITDFSITGPSTGTGPPSL